jgi:hypothetical protein
VLVLLVMSYLVVRPGRAAQPLPMLPETTAPTVSVPVPVPAAALPTPAATAAPAGKYIYRYPYYYYYYPRYGWRPVYYFPRRYPAYAPPYNNKWWYWNRYRRMHRPPPVNDLPAPQFPPFDATFDTSSSKS